MILAVVALCGGVLTIFSPCILPVVPFVLARTERPFARSTLPLLIGMAAAFAGISTLAAVGGGWAVHVNDYGRLAAMVLLTLSALALLSRRLADRITRPLVALGSRLASHPGGNTRGSIATSLLLGLATGLLWAPCAGPILGLILTGAALRGPSVDTSILLLAYALGAACSLGLVAAASTRVIAAMKRSFGAGEWLRRALGAAVLIAVVAIALGWDTGALTRLSESGTNHFEQSLLDRIAPRTAHAGMMAMQGAMQADPQAPMMNARSANSDAALSADGGSMSGHPGATMTGASAGAAPPVEGELPSLDGAVQWLNSPPLTAQALRGKVLLIDFWTYSCINCLRALPYVKSWYARYRDQGLVVIGVHAPEFAFEKNPTNVSRAVHDLGITYPVALDNNYAIWKAFNNEYWPAHYFIDAQGRIRGHHFGEGDYAQSEQLIRELLSEAGAQHLGEVTTQAVQGNGVQASADEADVESPETYVGYERADNFVPAGGLAHDEAHAYAAPTQLRLNQWALSGVWKVEGEKAVAGAPHDRILFRFHARDLHLVLGPAAGGRPVRFRVTIDGHAPGADHGIDVQSDGAGTVTEQRLYQLLRQSQPQSDHTFEIEFLDAGVQAYSFTFG
ncbi:MAG TPA: cytochrome c biogenesis protein CcdA [Steroidobacteraceae bacterium]|nr:cytochrome c biogenesis protein CcdA [Steroidobacteraceae bacterium]